MPGDDNSENTFCSGIMQSPSSLPLGHKSLYMSMRKVTSLVVKQKIMIS